MYVWIYLFTYACTYLLVKRRKRPNISYSSRPPRTYYYSSHSANAKKLVIVCQGNCSFYELSMLDQPFTLVHIIEDLQV